MTTKIDDQRPTPDQLRIAAEYLDGSGPCNSTYPTWNTRLEVAAWLRSVTQEPSAAIEADRQGRMPSDEELLKWAGEEQFFLFCDEDEFLQIAREVLSRYGSSQPAASAQPTKRPYAQSATLGEYGIIPECDTRSDTSEDGCTDPENCRRCQTLPEHRGDMQHAGIGSYPSKPATQESYRDIPENGYEFRKHVAPVAQEPIGEVFTMEPLDGSGDVRSHALLNRDLPAGTKLYAAPMASGDAHWYSVASDGRAMLCVDRSDAEKEAAEASLLWPENMPYRAVQLVPVNAQDQQDAARYRWLRNESWAGYHIGKGKPQVAETIVFTEKGCGTVKTVLAEEALDAAVDAARAKEQ